MQNPRRVTRRDRLRYRVDQLMSRGAPALVVGLFIITLLIVVVVSLLIWAAGWAGTEGFSFLDVLWRAVLATLDTGAIGNFTDGAASATFLLAMLAVTFVGIFLTSILIGILVTGIQGRLEELRKGKSRVIETGQTAILGWSQQVFTIISELIVANENHPGRSIVVLADRDKVQMEDEIRARVGHARGTRIVCRSGSPIDLTDLEIASVQTARSIILVSPEVADPDADVIKTMLAITNSANRRTEPYHIVAELRDPDSLETAQIVGRDEAQLVLSSELIARLIAHTCRRPGLSVVYTELLDFEGDEIYVADPPAHLVGRTFAECLLWYDDSTLIGILTGDNATLNPPGDRIVAEGDRLIAISRDDDTVRPLAERLGGVRDDLIVAPVRRARKPERTLILDWNSLGPSIIRELDTYVASGSEIVVVCDRPVEALGLAGAARALVNSTLDVQRGETNRRRPLTALCEQGFDHVIVLCSDDIDPQRADARALVTLIQLRDIAANGGHEFSITSEMLDLRNRALADITRADDFIVSGRLTSLLLSQVSENRHLMAIFDDLFDPQGSEIYLRPAAEYVRTGEPMTFATVVEAALRRGETAIGYRQVSRADEPDGYGVVINPVKSAPLTLEAADRLVVLAREE